MLPQIAKSLFLFLICGSQFCVRSEDPDGSLSAAAQVPPMPPTLEDITPSTGINYSRGFDPQTMQFLEDNFFDVDSFSRDFVFAAGHMGIYFGMPGVALLDYDGDGELDIYAASATNTPNSLYHNNGDLTFTNTALSAGVEAFGHNSSGVCFADIDNDSDLDLFVCGYYQPNLLFENNGDGTFTDISANLLGAASGMGKTSTGCSIGDVNGDGLHDITVGTVFPGIRLRYCAFDIPGTDMSNQLLINQGSNQFEDESAARGIEFPDGPTWAVMLVDYDQDGDLDFFNADDQCLLRPTELPRGYIRLYLNNGSGFFTDETLTLSSPLLGGFMGFASADFNHDGFLDIFATDFGHYGVAYTAFLFGNLVMPIPPPFQGNPRWILQKDDGSGQLEEVVNDLGFTGLPFGWGCGVMDYNNDGTTDIIYHGGMQLTLGPSITDNPGVLLLNDGTAHFNFDQNTLSGTDHIVRHVHGVAIGDLDKDGYPDVVSVSTMNYNTTDVIPYDILTNNDPFFPPQDPQFAGLKFGSANIFLPVNATHLSRTNVNWTEGNIIVEINSGGGKKDSISVTLVGSVGVIMGAKAPRDGIGAIISVKPKFRPHTQIIPVIGGDSHASQGSLTKLFGLDGASSARVDVLWPGGCTNRVDDVKKGDHVIIHEIPCDILDDKLNYFEFRKCVTESLWSFMQLGILTEEEAVKLEGHQTDAFLSLTGYSYEVSNVDCGDCHTSHNSRGCSAKSIAACVCEVDSYCCRESYDDTCVDIAKKRCSCSE